MAALRVLLIEDDEAYAAIVRTEVQSSDIDLERVATMDAARSTLIERHFDAILLDLSLPDSQGLDSVAAAHRIARSTAIVVLTSSADEQMAITALQHGAQDYLLKHEVDGPAILRAVRYARERASFQRALRDSERRFRALVEHGHDVITLLDEQGLILFDSRSIARIMGYSPEERLGRNLMEFLHPEDVEMIGERFAYCLSHPDEVLVAEYRFLHKDGTWRWGEAAGVNRLQEPGVQAIVVNHRDITERKLVEQELRHREEQLRQAHKMEAVGRLAGGIAHDFNNVLTAIFGYTDLLLEQITSGDPRRADVQEIRRSAERAASLTRQLLAFSRKQVMQPRTLDLNAVIGSLEKLLTRLVGEDVEVRLQLDPRLVTVRADPGQVEQVLMNLAANARDAMPDGGRITITTRNEEVLPDTEMRPDLKPGTYAVMSVRDSGTGMPGNIITQIFEPFFTTKEMGKGTGLGLATVYGIVKQSGGGIYVESELGQGTTFVVCLPRMVD